MTSESKNNNNNKIVNKKNLFLLIKIIIGVGLFAVLLLWNDNLNKLLQIFSTIKWEYIAALMLLGIITNIVTSLRWELFLKERGINIPHIRLFNLVIIGKFFNNFMPSMIGGDLTRIYLLGRQIDSQSKSAASVFLERFTGLIAMILMGLIFSLFNIKILAEPLIGISISVMIMGCILFFILLFNESLVDAIGRKLKFIPYMDKLVRLFKKLLNDISFFKDKYRMLVSALGLSFVFHLLTAVGNFICCYAIGFHPSFIDIAVITPIILLVVMIPVSPNNIGWWEWTFGVLLVNAGAGVAQGVAVALILRVTSLIFSMYGGLLFLFEKTGNDKTVQIPNL